MSDLFGNHIVGFPTRRLNFLLFLSLETCLNRRRCPTRPTRRKSSSTQENWYNLSTELSVSVAIVYTKHSKLVYCLNTIFQKLYFSKSHFSERSQEKYEHVTISHSKSLKKCHKNFEIRLTNKNFMQENIFD